MKHEKREMYIFCSGPQTKIRNEPKCEERILEFVRMPASTQGLCREPIKRPREEQSPPQGNDEVKTASLQSVSNVTNQSGSCIAHTKNNPECKECCDCLLGDDNTRKNCRDACATYDFSQNMDFIAVSTVSVLGPDGDYSVCAGTGSEQACKECCDGSLAFACGDRRFCRDMCNAMGRSDQPSSHS